MKDITIKITGKQMYDGQEENEMEFVTEGKVYQRNDAIYMVYDESEVSGMTGCKTTLRLKDNSIRMKRIGDEGFNSELCFEKGQRFCSVYETPYGSVGIEVLTKSVMNRFDPTKMQGTIDIDCAVSLEGMAEGKNQIQIKVM